MATRRDFIRISALGAGGLTVGLPAIRSWAGGLMDSEHMIYEEMLRTPTYCEICFWKCAGWVHKNSQGDLWKITGNDEDLHSNGRFCPRGTGGVGMYNDENRLKTPLIRTTTGNKQSYREASWEEALDFIAEKLQQVISSGGPESVALFSHGSGGKYFSGLLKAIGSNSSAAPSYAQCKGPREAAFLATFGETVESPERTDIRDTRCMVLIGSHIGENMHNGQVQEMSDAIDKGATIITVDPRFSTAASKSKFWLPIKPSTDLALLLAWMNVIIGEGLYDKAYVEKYTTGFDKLENHVKSFTPEWAYGITTITPQVIRETARVMAHAAPAVIIHPGRHVTWYGDDVQRLRAIAILNAILGSWGRRGGFYRPESLTVPEFPHPHYPEIKKGWRDILGDQYPLADQPVANAIVDLSRPAEGREAKYKAWIVNGTNLIETMPNQANTIEAIKALDLLVVIDTMPMEITGYADVVLPECTYLERYDDIRVSPHRKPQLALRMPAVKPKYDTKPAWWMVKKLADKMGLEAYFPWKDIEEMLAWQLKQMGTSLEEMQRIGVKTFDRAADDLYFADGEEVEFSTTSQKIELYSSDLESAGYAALPVYTPHEEPPAGYYRLIYGRAPMHTFTRTSNNPNLADLMDENTVWINPKVAKEWGLANEQYIYLKNQDGIQSDFRIRVRVTERIRWDSVYMVHGFGHNQKKLQRCFGRGASDTQMITKVLVDPSMGGTGMRGNFVTFLTEKEEVKS
jgi:thiosulfate reductase / polysulfide reductase chain A